MTRFIPESGANLQHRVPLQHLIFDFMNKRVFSTCAACFVCSFLIAQPPVLKLSLEDCLRRALESNATIKKTKLDQRSLTYKIKEKRAQSYPQIYANVGLESWFQQPTNFLQGDLFGRDGYVPTTLGKPFQLNGELRLDQRLVAPGVFSGGKLKDAAEIVAALLVEKSEEEVFFQVSQHFYLTAQNQALVSGVQANLDRLDALMRTTEIQLKNDLATPTDVKRLRVARTNLETQKQTLLLGIEYQLGVLNLMTGLPYDKPIELATDALIALTDTTVWSGDIAPMLGTTDIKLLFKSLEINKLRAKTARSENWPSFDAFARLGYLTQRIDPNFFNPKGSWYPLAGVGLKMRYPIFDGFGQKNRVQQLDLESQKTEEDVRQLENFKILEFSFAKKQMRNSLRTLDAQRGNNALAIEVYGKILQQYKEGIISLNDVLTVQTAASEAETNLNREIFNYKLAELRFLKSVGRLRELVRG
jgi:outer membrane protein